MPRSTHKPAWHGVQVPLPQPLAVAQLFVDGSRTARLNELSDLPSMARKVLDRTGKLVRV